MNKGEKVHYKVQDNIVWFGGLDFESKPLLVEENEKFILVKVPGRRCWNGIGNTIYVSPELLLMEKIANDPDRTDSAAILLEEVDLNRQNSRKEKARLLVKMSEL